MPSPVPPGYSRGPLLFTGPLTQSTAELELLQAFWNLAGAFGSRIVQIVLPSAARNHAGHHAHILESWDCDTFLQIQIQDRATACRTDLTGQIAGSTAILIASANPLQAASILGGTPVAQSIRRANAHGKVVCAIHESSTLPCQHILTISQQTSAITYPSRDLVTFTPGLGLINRTIFVVHHNQPSNATHVLTAAIAHNPFLIAIAIAADTGVIIHPDNTLHVAGPGHITIADASTLTNEAPWTADPTAPLQLDTLTFHHLRSPAIYDLDTHRQVTPKDPDDPYDLPDPPQHNLKSAF